MARFEIDIDDSFFKQLQSLDTNFDENAKRLLNVAEPILKSSLESALVPHRRYGTLIGSLKAKIGKTKNGDNYIVVRPTGKDSKTGARNMEKLMYLHYGTKNQSATGVVTIAVNNATAKVINAMKKEMEAITNE